MMLIFFATASLSLLFALLAVLYRDLLTCAIFLGASSLFLALTFFILQAPDIAITEASVGAALSTFLFLMAIAKTEQQE